MNERIHRWLDGELPLEALSPDEREEALRLNEAIVHAAGAADRASPGLASRVLAALPPGRRARSRPWLVRLAHYWLPRGQTLRPVAAAAALSLLLGFGLGLWSSSLAPGPADDRASTVASPQTEPGPATVYVRFDVRVEGAERVQLAGSFSDWEPRYELSPAQEDHWTVTVPLEPGVHDYIFLVDGSRQVLDPAAPRIADGFGSYNNRIALLTSAT